MSRQALTADVAAAARAGERRAVGRLLTFVERGGERADEVTELVHPHIHGSPVIGITGAPGSGKSTLVGRLVADLAANDLRPAVLAVDPSSPLTGGAILGDRIRMDDHDPRIFIRSMATRGHAGGLALAVPGMVRVFDAVGYDPVIIETVGVGQVEVDISAAADTTVVVVTPGAGDAVQANKAGLLEVADVFVVNKSDRPGANDARRDLELMLDLSHTTGQEEAGYRPPIVMTNSLEGEGVADVWAAVEAHRRHLVDSGRLRDRHARRARFEISSRLETAFDQRRTTAMQTEEHSALVEAVLDGTVSPAEAARAIARTVLRG